MNAILSQVEAMRGRFELDRFDLGERVSCVILTPRFRTSRHVVALLIPNGAVEPSLVVKMPRLEGDGEGIAREVRVLRALEKTCPQTNGSVPKVVAFADGDRPVLIETALVGSLVTRTMLRAAPSLRVDAIVTWLMGLSSTPEHGGSSFERLIVEPLSSFAESFPKRARERELVARTLEIVSPLREARLPRVFEHGDLSHPNLIWLPSDRVGVVDWELAEDDGFPLYDLCFFLAYATFALRKPRKPEEYVAAFDDAFFGGGGWAASRVNAYAHRLELDDAVVMPLFVSCWARYAAQLVTRIAGDRPGLSEESALWIRQNRYYAFWEHSLDHFRELSWRR